MTKWTAAGVAAVTALALVAGTFGTTYAAGNGEVAPTPDEGNTVALKALSDATDKTGCTDVQDWDTLKSCLEGENSNQITTITAMIAPGDTPIKIHGSAILAAKDGDGIGGADGTTANLGEKRVFQVDEGNTFTVTGGIYQNLAGTASGALIHQNGGSVILSGGSYRNNTSGNGSVVFQENGDLTIAGGTFTGNKATATGITNDTATKGGGVVYAKSNVVISGGTFTENFVPEAGGVVQLEKGKLTISGGEFTGNRSSGRMGGGIAYQQSGTTVISGGMFNGNKTTYIGASAQGGSVVNLSTGSLSVSGGTFKDNSADSGRGGVFYQRDGSTWITGKNTSFTGNSAVALDQNGRQPKKGYAGGGVLYSNYGSVEITGGTFTGNHANASAYMSGGGVIYATGKLTIANAADGTKPTFTRNWASVDAQYPMKEDATTGTLTGKIGQGGAGGAIFLQKNNASYGYFLGGEFEGNISGYLGGAIYTEEGTVSYVGPAAATLNTAGHFGGGLWFCPSGVSDASKSGNIALNGNTVNSAIDSNEDNKTSDNEPTEAGSDLAIMNPYHKALQEGSKVHDNAFQLLDTWFTDRGTKVVDWYWDGQPRTSASGYGDGYMYSDVQGNNGKDAVRAYKYDGSDQYDDVSGGPQKQKDNKYQREGNGSYHETGTTLQQYWGKAGHGNTYGGIGLKAVLNAEGKKVWQSAWDNAKVTFQHNGARLSGGAFGSNGRVILATPYSAAWNKVDNTDQHNALKGSSWRVSAKPTDGSMTMANSDRLGYDSTCPTDNKDSYPADPKYNGCWMHREGDADGVLSIIVADNDARDNNPADGEFGIDNLKPDVTYSLIEEIAPSGYAKSDAVYQFTTSSTQTEAPEITVQTGNGTVVDDANEGVARGIVNVPLPGLHWDKKDADTGTLLPGSVWKITKTGTSGWSKDVDDCAQASADQCTTDSDKLLDVNPEAGQFEVKDLEAGSYELTEETAPEGHWLTESTYTFTVVANSTDPIKLTKQGEPNPLTVNQIDNQAMGVAWVKADSGDRNGNNPLANSEWKIYPTDGGSNSANAIVVTDCAKDPCPANSTDLDKAQGKFKVTGLTPGKYTLEETKAPDGYELPTKPTWTFEIKASNATSGAQHTIADVVISGDNLSHSTSTKYGVNLIFNARTPVSVLPFTGGTGLGRLLMGGGFAAAAALAAAVTYEWRRRRALDM